jgi:MFS family permease
VGGIAVDRFGERACTVTGILIVSLSSFAAGLAQSFPQLVLARGFGGAGSALFIGGLMNRILRIIEPRAMGRATGTFRSSFLVGTGMGPFVGGVVAQRLGLRAPLFIYAAALVVAAVIAWVAMAGGPTVRRAERRSPVEALRAAKPLFADIRYVGALAATLAGWWTISGPAQTVGALFAKDQLDFAKSEIGLAISLLAVGEFLALLFVGRLADRRGRRFVLLPALVAMASATLLLGRTAGAPWAFFVAMLVIGASIAASGTAAGGLLGDSIPKGGSGAAVGVNQMAGDLGYLVAPVTIAWLAEKTSFPLAYMAGAIPATLVFFVALRLPER